jgi:acyl-coenzyme A synthetase/AMP-(fatty) acid ligase
MSLGATLYLGPVEQPEAQAEWVLQHGITATVTTPPSISRLARTLARAGRQRDTQLRFVLVGGKNLSPSQKHQLLETLGPVVYEYYGSTETGVNTIAEPADLMACPESVGRPYDGNRVVILDEAGRLLPAGLQGRVAVSSYLMMDHYADGSANDTRIDGERFLLTPDAGFFDAQGRLHVLNRACGKDGNFDTYGVEEQLRALPDIVDLAVMVRTDAPDGARVADCGFTLAPQASAVQLRSQVRAFLKNAGLVPRHVEALAAIPYSLSGKVRWSELERLLREAQPPRAVAA